MFIFPAHLFNPKEVNARVVQRVMSGGVALSGDEDVISTDGGGRWQIDYAGIEFRTAAQQRAWSAWQGYLAGGAVECLVPLLSLPTAPRASQWDRPMKVTRVVANDDLFPESVAYAVPQIVAHLSANATLRATTLQITVSKGAPIRGGEKLSIGERAYRIVRPTAPDTFQIEPPLRGAVTTGDEVNFDWPVVKCRMAPGEDFEGPITRGRFGTKSISFVESF